jgi:predicted amidohydrolase
MAQPGSSGPSTTSGLVLPPPPPVPEGYIRAAAVQLDFRAAAVCRDIHLLEQPPMSPKDPGWPDWFGVAANSLPRVVEWQKEIGRELRSLYVECESRRLRELLEVCRRWGVQLLVFPEYSVSPECLDPLLPQTKGMTVVFGTHAVEPHLIDSGYYGRFGIAAPPCGTAVAPVAVDGALHCYQPKLNATNHELGMTLGTQWDPVTITNPVTTCLGILICLDYLSTDELPYHTYVGTKIKGCRILAVPSLTPKHTTDEFEARSIVQSKRYGRPVVYANIADGGETSIFVDSEIAQPGVEFPYGIPQFARFEEGMIVADIDCDYTGVDEKSSRRYSSRPATIPRAASVFRYGAIREHLEISEELASIFRSCDLTERQQISAAISANIPQIISIATRSTETAQRRLNMLHARYAQARCAEDLLRMLRDIEFSEDVVPMPQLDLLRLKAARVMAKTKARDSNSSIHEEDVMLQLRKRLIALCGEG